MKNRKHMTITINTNKVIDHLKSISHREVSEIADVNARYRAEAGSEKEDLISDCIRNAGNKILHRCLRFIDNSYVEESNNEFPDLGSFVFEFEQGSGRRFDGKADVLTDAMHTFMVEYALAKFYSTVSQGELSNKHSMLALEAGNAIDDLLYR